MLLCVSHWYPPGNLDCELVASSGYQTLLLHTIEDTTLDFYQIPNGAYAYLHGGSLSGVVPHGVKAYWIGHPLNNYNVYHPLFTLILGSVLILFEPTKSFYVWMCLKFFITLWMVIYFYKAWFK
jgi:hypothetical protein